MSSFSTRTLEDAPMVAAPDGSTVRILLALDGGSMAHFELRPGQVARAVVHRTVEEIWYVLSGEGEMWRKQGAVESVAALRPGVCLTLPVGTHFQFRASDGAPLRVVASTLPPWPGEGEAVASAGPWPPTAAD